MGRGEQSWYLGKLSDQELLHGLDAVIRAGRRALAELLAHLAELEERRLHLRAACPSLFSYCVSKLGFSEDEACRRIDVARLARRFPALFPLLASGELTLSVAALLKPYLTEANSEQLVAAVAGKTVQHAREVLAAFSPQPDVPSVVRKLPERTPQPAPSAPAVPATYPTTTPDPAATVDGDGNRGAGGCRRPTTTPDPAATVDALASSIPPPSVPKSPTPRPAQRIAPLAPARFKIEFTADAELKAQLELARDLMRHANPSGDFAPIFARALTLLIADIQKRRFGSRPNSAASRERPPPATGSSAVPPPDRAVEPAIVERTHSSSHIPRATRRRVAERDGLRCCWTDESGKRCDSQAWLEHDHRLPRGKGGGSEEGNLRLFCRNHNRLEAERQFGREHVDSAIARAQRARRGRKEVTGEARSAPEHQI